MCLTAALATAGLTGCPTRPSAPLAPAGQPTVPQTPTQAPGLPREGRPYDIVSGDSLLTLLVFRGGALAKAGHNHVIASHALSGTLYVPADLSRSTLEVHFPVAELAVDEVALRAKENEADFPPDVPDSAKEGTRKNMLGGALLDSEHYPEIVLRSAGPLEPVGPMGQPVPAGDSLASRSVTTPGGQAQWLAHVQVTVRDRTTTIVVPLHYERHADEIVVSGEFPLKQTDLGLTPFSALLGALQVVDEMKVRAHIVARAAATQTGR